MSGKLALLFLAGAAVSALNAGGFLGWAGVLYYVLCGAAVSKRHEKAAAMLALAAGIHVILTAYAIWNWQVRGTELCPYCLSAMGFVFAALAAHWRPVLIFVPAIAALAVWYAWPWVFVSKEYTLDYPRNRYEWVRPPGSQAENAENMENAENHAGFVELKIKPG